MKFYGIFLIILFSINAHAQQFDRDFDFKINGSIVVTNLYGRVFISAEDAQETKVSLKAESPESFSDSEIKIKNEGGRIQIDV
ncbi:MAG: hypothetical protein ACR2L1_03730, partial [Pyrinomonadaceae bacterium]